MKKNTYLKEMLAIGLPITLQSIFQASYSFIDQLMIGTLGTTSIAGCGLGGKFSGLVLFTLSSVSAVASILISQYHGVRDKKGINQSFFSCSYIAFLVMLVFAVPAFFAPASIMRIYTKDAGTIHIAAGYLQILAVAYIPMTITLMISAFFRSMEMSKYPMFASIFSLLGNILFNYILIFGKFGAPRLGLNGAALGTLLSRSLEALLLIGGMIYLNRKEGLCLRPVKVWDIPFYKRISNIILPILFNEFSWSLGENIYAMVYGRLGTAALAAMTLTNPLQGMFIGMFSGVSSASVVMVGKRLGQDEFDEAYDISKFLVKFGLIGSVAIGILLAFMIPFYVRLFAIEAEVAQLTIYIVYALALVLFAKITNMILSGGVLRSGGKTKITLVIDLIGTWGIGVPLALLTGLVFHLPIYIVYFILSLEEVVRLIIGVYVFKSKRWMKNIT